MTGKRPKELDDLLEFPTDMMYQWKYFIDLHNKRTSSGFSANPITYTDMCSYFSLIRYRPEEWEITLHSAAIRFMTHDSFLVKLFVPDKVRLKRAFRNAKRLYELLREDASERGRQMRALNNEFIEERNSLKTNFPKLFNPYFHR